MNSKSPKKIDFLNYSFKGKLWKDKGKGAWHFITISKKLSNEIRKAHKDSEEGWGRLKTTASICETTWNTSMWFDTKAGAYLLPINSTVRKKEKLSDGESIEVHIEFNLDKWMLNKQ